LRDCDIAESDVAVKLPDVVDDLMFWADLDTKRSRSPSARSAAE
jgi:hypothetical protein